MEVQKICALVDILNEKLSSVAGSDIDINSREKVSLLVLLDVIKEAVAKL